MNQNTFEQKHRADAHFITGILFMEGKPMVCDTVNQEERIRRERQKAIEELEKQLKDKSAKIVKVGNNVSIDGWNSRGAWCDACAIRKLKMSNDATVRMMVATAVPAGQALTFGHSH